MKCTVMHAALPCIGFDSARWMGGDCHRAGRLDLNLLILVLAGSNVVVDRMDCETASVCCLTVTGISDSAFGLQGRSLTWYPGHRLACSELYLGIFRRTRDSPAADSNVPQHEERRMTGVTVIAPQGLLQRKPVGL